MILCLLSQGGNLRDRHLSHSNAGEKLGATHHATLVLRLVLNDRGQIVHGELVDASLNTPRRFLGWQGMLKELGIWLDKTHRQARLIRK